MKTNPFLGPARVIPPEEIAANRDRVTRLRTRIASHESDASLEIERALLSDLARIAELPGHERFAKVGTRLIPLDRRPNHGESRLGGAPDLPRGAAWPLGPDGAPLTFLAQVNLRDLDAGAQADFPWRSDALVSLFYDSLQQPWGTEADDRDRFQVRIDPADDLVRIPPPTAHDPSSAVTHVPTLTLPAVSSPAMEHLDREARVRWGTVTDAFDRARPGVRHQFGGHPQLLQGPIELASAFGEAGIPFGHASQLHPRAPELRAQAREWHLLFQIDSEPARGWYWGDAGRLYANIREDHLTAGRGDHAWITLQRD